MGWLLSILTTTWMVLLPLVNCADFYVITVPNQILPKSTVPIVITNIGDGKNNTQLAISATITGSGSTKGDQSKPKSFSASGNISVPTGTTTTLNINIGNWPSGIYNVNVKGNAGVLNFDRIVTVGFNNKKSSLFIQTDKGIYQTGQKVNFRVFSVNGQLLPYVNQNLIVYINDGAGNRIQQWNTVVPPSGIFEGDLQLSSQPVEGSWGIYASVQPGNLTVNGASTSVNFQVLKYVLPRFSVIVIPPPFITPNTTDFPVTITAEYTYGQPVQGNFLINVSQSYCYSYSGNPCATPVVVRGKFNGSKTVTIKTGDLNLGKSLMYGSSLQVFGSVIEEFTGIQMNDTQYFSTYSYDKQISVNVPSNFKPLLPYTFTIGLTTPVGTPVTGVEGQSGIASLNYGFKSENKTFTFNKDGTATVTVTPPEDTQTISINVYYKDLTSSGYSTVSGSLSNKFISINANVDNPTVGQTITISVLASFPLENFLSYQVTGRGKVVSAKTIALKKSSTTTKFSFKITRDMSPTLAIAVFYVTTCGEIVGDSLVINVDGALATPLSLQFSPNKTQPGTNITVSIKTLPSTTVALLAVDQSVLLLSSGNYITKSQVYSELYQYGLGGGNYQYNSAGYIGRATSQSIDQIFQTIGVQVLTNGLYFKQQTCYPTYFDNIALGGGFRPMVALETVKAQVAPPGSAQVEPTSVRINFADIFLWTTVTTSNVSGETIIETTVPDQITSWALTGIALNSKTGLGLTDRPANLTVVKPFFLVVNLPYQVVRGETVAIQVLVFNYFAQDLQAFVTIQSVGSANDYILEDNAPTKNVTVKSNDVQAVSFLLQPTVAGFIALQFKATSTAAGDAIRQTLRVKPEGVTQYYNQAYLVDLRTKPTFDGTFNVTVPNNAVPGSTYIQFNGIGNIMGNIISNLNNLVRLPSGCGEQNMVNFVPDIVVLIFLNKINRLPNDLRAEIINYLQIGYQTELTYKRYDGSFSTFGNTDISGSVWLTAFVVKSFEMAKPYITIEPTVLQNAKEFILRSQTTDGSFNDTGRVVDNIQGGSALTPLTLTAYVIISFLETPSSDNAAYLKNIAHAVTYLENNFDKADNPYSVTIVTYALQLANSSKANVAFTKMNSLSTKDGDLTYWRYEIPKSNDSNWWWNSLPRPLDVEATGYALLTYIKRGESPVNLLPLVAWLVSKQSSLGGYSSTQDTVIGIQALGQAGPDFVGPVGSSVQLTVTYGSSNAAFTFNQQNELVRQQQEILPNTVRSVQIKGTGNGVALAQVEWNYNVLVNNTGSNVFKQKVTVTPLRQNSNTVNSYILEVCSSYLYNGSSGMIIVEANTLSGFIWTGLPATDSVAGPQRVETSNSNTVVSLYYNQFPNPPDTVCATLIASETIVVSNRQCAFTSVYRYYNNDGRAESCYNLPA
ncbi:CD109 molecule [Chamberlinius hualienensis]